jgi:hypothetical protein
MNVQADLHHYVSPLSLRKIAFSVRRPAEFYAVIQVRETPYINFSNLHKNPPDAMRQLFFREPPRIVDSNK